jgi:hypothetical protein
MDDGFMAELFRSDGRIVRATNDLIQCLQVMQNVAEENKCTCPRD